jgi:SsrA-binding protein
MSVIAVNKRANFDYDIQEIYEAGLVLLGYEVKSVKTGHISLKGSYVTFSARGGSPARGGHGIFGGKKSPSGGLPEAYLTNAHIPLYKFAGAQPSYDPLRPRKLLLNKKEIKYLMGKKQEQGLTLVPTKIYTKRSLIKLEFGVGKGRKKYDKRELIKKRELDRQVRTLKIKNKI